MVTAAVLIEDQGLFRGFALVDQRITEGGSKNEGTAAGGRTAAAVGGRARGDLYLTGGCEGGGEVRPAVAINRVDARLTHVDGRAQNDLHHLCAGKKRGGGQYRGRNAGYLGGGEGGAFADVGKRRESVGDHVMRCK